ncbi:MAG: DNA polymerase III subunit alpha, partial [Erysipelotrichaceae bacterium]|nr:DNA polymerase III subunit alpha [Erysipelotrichaceae bacterium]
NLMGLSSFLCTGEKKTADLATLNRYRGENFLIVFSDDMPLTHAFDKGLPVEEYLERQEFYFGKDYLVALADHDIAANRIRDEKLKPLLQRKGIRTIAWSRTYFLEKEDYDAYRIAGCIRDKKGLEESDPHLDEGRYLHTPEELEGLYDRDDLLNADVLGSFCRVLMDYKTSLPVYECKSGISSSSYLTALCQEGLKRRLKGQVTKEYRDRLKEELDVILKMHFEDYFLIVYDFILYAKKNGILVGPGRGSAAGSLVSYCLGITEIDPLRFGLLFERFLNPERITMPDIDTDFPDDRRDEVIRYVRDKYGEEHVAHILTFGTLKAKQVLRDVGRVLGYPSGELDPICRLVPQAPDASLRGTYETVALFRQKIESDARYRRLYSLAEKLEGLPRHESTHAAGIVLSRDPLQKVVPLIRVEEDVCSTQFTMEYLEELGLIKMDFLAIRNLSIIAEIVEEVNKTEPLDIRKIPLDDKKTFELIGNVNTMGIFQLESNGMKSLVRKMRPKNFEEIGMTIALFRPGPMENIPAFLENRAHPETIRYLHEDLRPVLEETYGIIVYQEQIMTIARTMAGFSYGKADVLRRAMSKKKASELEGLKDEFLEGCRSNGYDPSVSEKVYELILKFANYGFNKSHSVVYGMVAYEMAYLKANYPLSFYKALLNGVIGSESKTYDYISECLSIGQKVSGVSINDSELIYRIDRGSI